METTANEPATAAGNIDQIRDIIFGNQMRDYDRRFSQLEERLLKDSADLRDEFRQRLTNLEEYVRREMDTLSDRVSTEQRSRTGAVQEISGAVEQLGRNTDRRFGELGEEAAKAQRDLRSELARHATSFAEELQRRAGDLGAALKRESDELHHRKADRATLGALFAEVAARLAEESGQPNDT